MADPKFIKASYNEEQRTVEYVADNGDRLLRRGGTIAWRFNNPGNLRPGPKYKLHIGQGKTASGMFLVFPTPEAGREEKRGLLLRKYKDVSIARMLYTYAPPQENDTEGYIDSVCRKTGFSRDRIIGEFSHDEMTKLMTAMEEHEGYYHKKETREEIWVKTTTVNFSDGARPTVDLPVKIKRGSEEMLAKTNAYGQLAPFLHVDTEESLEIWTQGTNEEWTQLETLTLGHKSKACTFVNNLLTVRSFADLHSPPIHAQKKPLATRYVVQPGDTLSQIAAKFKVDAKKVQKDNEVKHADHIYPGLVLMIYRGDGAAPPRFSLEIVPARPEGIASLTRSKEGKGHPVAILPTSQKRAPWMEIAIAEAKRWAGKKEDVITKESNYHALLKTGLKTLVGNSNPWCASFVNWCLKQAGYPPTTAAASSQSFKRDKNYILIEKPVYGAIAVFTDQKRPGRGHVGFLYAFDENNHPIILGGNQSDSITFENRFSLRLGGYYIPISYSEFAKSDTRVSLPINNPSKLNALFGIKTQKKTLNSTL